MMSGPQRRPRVLAPRNNPFANDGSAQSFSRAGAPRFRHPTQCRGWSPLLPEVDDSPHSELPSNLRRVQYRLDALRDAIQHISNDVHVIDICNKSNPICGVDCCLRPKTSTNDNYHSVFPERWWEGPIHSTSRNNTIHHEGNNENITDNKTGPQASGSHEPFVWWAGVVSPGPPLSPIPPITTTTAFVETIPGSNVAGAQASNMRPSSVLASPRIREPPNVRPTTLSVSSSSTSNPPKTRESLSQRKALSSTSSTTSTSVSSPSASSRSRSNSNSNSDGTQDSRSLPHVRNPTTQLAASLSQGEEDCGTILSTDESQIPSLLKQGTSSIGAPSSTTNMSSSSWPHLTQTSSPGSPSGRRRPPLRARRVLPPTNVRLVTSPTTPENGVPLEIPPFSPPNSSQANPQPPPPPSLVDEEEDTEHAKRRAELVRLLSDSQPGKTFHPGSSAAMTGTGDTLGTAEAENAAPDTGENESVGLGVVIVLLLLLAALGLLATLN